MRFGIAMTFILIYCFTTELYPTQIRGLAFGIANTFGRIATLVATCISALDSDVFMWINVAVSIFMILLTLFLPETKGIELTDKIKE